MNVKAAYKPSQHKLPPSYPVMRKMRKEDTGVTVAPCEAPLKALPGKVGIQQSIIPDQGMGGNGES